MPKSLEQLKAQQEKFEKSSLLKGGVKVEDRFKECTKCREMKKLEDFDSDEKICEDCVEEMELEKKVKTKEEKPVKTETKPVKTRKPRKTKPKLCLTCGEKDPSNFYPKNKTICKACTIKRNNEKDEAQALELWPKIKKAIGRDKRVTIKKISYCIKKSKPKVLIYCKILVDKGYLECFKEGRTNYFRLAKKPEGQYKGLSDVFDEHNDKPSEMVNEHLELQTGVGEIKEEKTIETNLIEGVVNSMKNENTEAKEVLPLPVPIIEPMIDPLHQIIHESFPHAEEILITPGTNEIHIKLKS